MSPIAERKYSVYIHLFPNGKRYIGCTRQTPGKRWRYGQGYRHQQLLYSAICEYGWDNIEHIIVDNNLSEEDAANFEKKLIAQYKTQDPKYGYNTKNGGQTFGYHSDEFLEDLHNRMVGNKYCVGRKLRPQHIEALVRANKGSHRPSPNKGKHVHSAETKELISELAKARWRDPEYREKCAKTRPDMSGANNPMYGRKMSESTKAKISAKAKGRIPSRETREKMSLKRIKPVDQYNLDGTFVKRHVSLKSAAEEIGGNTTNITFACKHKNRTYKGFKWRYANEDT